MFFLLAYTFRLKISRISPGGNVGCLRCTPSLSSDEMKANKTKAGKGKKNTPVDVFRGQAQPVETCHFLLINRRNRLCP